MSKLRYSEKAILQGVLTGLLAIAFMSATASAQTRRPSTSPIHFNAITILPAGSAQISCGSFPDGEVGLSYSHGCSVSGGTAPYSWSGNPPGGLGFSAAGTTATVSGVPSSSPGGSFQISVVDSTPPTAGGPTRDSTTASINIFPRPSITGPRSLPDGTVGGFYSSQVFSATGGNQNYSWSSSGLPNGLSFSSSGVLSGTPAQGTAGIYNPSFTVTDSLGGNATTQLSLVINATSVSVTVTTNPAGLQVVVDGITSTAPVSLSWVQGSSHTIGVVTPQGAGATRSVFTSWSDGGGVSHNVTANASATYTASFKTQYALTVSVSPVGAGTVTANPSSGDTFYDSGTSVQLTASPSTGYQFQSWSGALTGSTNPQSVAMSAPRVVTANFGSATALVTIDTSPSGLQITIDGNSATAPQSATWTPGSTHSIGTPSPQGVSGGSRQVFVSWSDGGGQTHNVLAPSTSTTFIATFKTQYQITTSVSPAGGGTVTVSPSSTDGYYDSGTSVQVSATATLGGTFTGWSGDLAGTATPQSLVMNSSHSVTANFQTSANQLVIRIPSLPDGIVGVSYTTTQLQATGGTAPYTWTATGVPPGLTLSTGGILSGTPAANATGSYSMVITVTDSSSPPQSASQTFTGSIVVGTNVLSVSPGALTFQGDPTNKAQDNIGVFSSQPGTSFTAQASTTNGAPWLSIPSSFNQSTPTPATIVASVDPAGLAPGTYTGQIKITAPSTTPSTATVSVTLTVTPVTSPQLSLTVVTQSFALTQGGQPAQGLVTIANVGGGTLQFTATASSDLNWLSIVGTGAGTATPTSPSAVSFTVNPSGVPIGVHRGKITVKDASGTPYVGNITLQLSQTGLTYTAVTGGPTPPLQSLTVYNLGQGSMPWTAQGQTLVPGQNWLQTGAQGGSSTPQSPAQATVPVSQTGLATGQYYGSMPITAPNAVNSPQSASVLLNVVAPGQLGSAPQASPGGVILAGVAGNTAAAQQGVSLVNPTGASLSFSTVTFTEDGGNWLTVSPKTGTLSQSGTGTITIQGSLAGLSSTVKYGSVQVAFSEGTVRTIDVALVATAAASVPPEEATAQALPHAVGNNPAGCSPNQLVTVFQSPLQSTQVQVAQPQTVQVQILDNCQNQVTRANAGSAQVTFGNGDAALNLTDNGGGIWVGTWNPVTAKSNINVLVVALQGSLSGGRQIQLDVLAADTTSAAQPLAALNAASNDVQSAGLVAPGSWVSVYGARLSTGSAQFQTTPLPITLASAKLQVTGQPSPQTLPLSFASPGQVNGLIPQNVAVNTALQLTVQRGSTQSVPVTLTVTDLQPGIFTISQTGQGQGAVLLANTGTIAGPPGPGSQPVARNGFIEVYCTGLGAVKARDGSAPPGDGVPTPATTLYDTVATATATVGGINAPVIFSGLSPFNIALYQVNVQIPSNAPTGNAVPLVLTMTGKNGSVSSQTGVTIAVQ